MPFPSTLKKLTMAVALATSGAVLAAGALPPVLATDSASPVRVEMTVPDFSTLVQQNAAAVVMVGIAFGINEHKQAIGDVLVSDRLMLYDLQRVGQGKGAGGMAIIPRGDRPHTSPWLINRLQVAKLGWEGAKIRFGLVLSGDKLVDNVDFRGQLLGLEPEAIGGEMEGAGLYVACQNSKVDWILVKAICDWADGQKGAGHRPGSADQDQARPARRRTDRLI